MSSANRPWNINIHYDALLQSMVPSGAGRALDVGCGDGFLAARLTQRVPDVTALDLDASVLQRAQERFDTAPVRWVHGDVMTADLPRASFDAVLSNATLHHIDNTGAALERLADLVRAAGTLGVVAFVKPSLRNALWHSASWTACGVVNRVKGKWEHTAPIKWPPSDTLQELRAHVRAKLPGARVRRLLYGRALISWRAPG
ncbi:bifunctional 2-polyprenyl-6-hydroxyphenol methylase/3-demethylubiquinol 3-O-methyltransferase UbiG [Mycobacterium sp. 852002-51057_SCH5723018]|uniref:class I SAM-dependent methyltransferase n=1 Tax=Mycobacterium sp. 852002-51057_SCH5723018 TaxID=1834094 RepID=UPI0007FD2C05|nr:class I SAM-dependent methyltransferase [Mycobacterium sp. 852002-51057_SCH5723018]OBG23814.1 SAM-dependent methyltransferase [Mycobacterium sp. 852002-51057_SCH5723018]